MNDVDEKSLVPGSVRVGGNMDNFRLSSRSWQGIPGITATCSGDLIATWYSGGTDEGPENYVLLAVSKTGGITWDEPVAVVAPGDGVRAFDPVVWTDPAGGVWWFWSQSTGRYDGRAGVFCSRCLDPENYAVWAPSRRIADGVMMNKPTVLADRTWLAPVAVWSHIEPRCPGLEDLRFPMVFASDDSGENWSVRGRADVPNRTYDEHMIVERAGGHLWMLVRTRGGVGEAVSADGGRTWVASRGTRIEGPDSRFHIRRLASGRILLVNHHRFHKRNRLTAMLSDDEGRTWFGHLLLDERESVSYPDAVETADGTIWCIYDRKRYAEGEILLARFTERDVEAGQLVEEISELGMVVSRLRNGGTEPPVH